VRHKSLLTSSQVECPLHCSECTVLVSCPLDYPTQSFLIWLSVPTTLYTVSSFFSHTVSPPVDFLELMTCVVCRCCQVLELQQNLAVAVSTDRKKDVMIEQLDRVTNTPQLLIDIISSAVRIVCFISNWMELLSSVSKVTSSKYLLNKFNCFYGTALLWFLL